MVKLFQERAWEKVFWKWWLMIKLLSRIFKKIFFEKQGGTAVIQGENFKHKHTEIFTPNRPCKNY